MHIYNLIFIGKIKASSEILSDYRITIIRMITAKFKVSGLENLKLEHHEGKTKKIYERQICSALESGNM